MVTSCLEIVKPDRWLSFTAIASARQERKTPRRYLISVGAGTCYVATACQYQWCTEELSKVALFVACSNVKGADTADYMFVSRFA